MVQDSTGRAYVCAVVAVIKQNVKSSNVDNEGVYCARLC